MKVRWNNISLLIILLIGIGSCSSPRVKNMTEYRQWFLNKDNGFYMQKYHGGVEFSMLYKHHDLMAARDIEKGKVNDEIERKEIIKEYESGIAFVLKVGYDSREQEDASGIVNSMVNDYVEYQELIQELAFGLEDRITLNIAGKDYSPAITHFERGYELEKSASFLIAFSIDESPEDFPMIFVFDDDIFNSGMNKFHFDVTEIEIPEIPKI